MIRFDPNKRILLVGDVFVDRHLDSQLVRLGGIFHAARALDALRARYSVAYTCPAYLDEACSQHFAKLNAIRHVKVGDVTGSPNVMEISESTEAGDQGYSDLLKDRRAMHLDADAFSSLVRKVSPTDLLVIGGSEILRLATRNRLAARAHLDLDHDEAAGFGIGKNAATIFCSTSGTKFRRSGRKPEKLRASAQQSRPGALILKENRGGSTAWVRRRVRAIAAPCYPTETVHSVGVGDCFDATWVAAPESEPASTRLKGAAYVASLYAATFDHKEFVNDVAVARRIRAQLSALRGVRFGWAERSQSNIYLAAPDFPSVDTRHLDGLEAALRYHNFSPRRPIRENGLAAKTMNRAARRGLFSKDVALLRSCDLLIATPLTDDPGTFTELGWFANSGKPTILFDPRQQAPNLFAFNAATRVCNSLTAVIDTVFELLGRRM